MVRSEGIEPHAVHPTLRNGLEARCREQSAYSLSGTSVYVLRLTMYDTVDFVSPNLA